MNSLCILSIFNFCYFEYDFEGGIWVLIASVPDRCIHFTFSKNIKHRIRVLVSTALRGNWLEPP